jgi:polysaccharide export outer membrane protein
MTTRAVLLRLTLVLAVPLLVSNCMTDATQANKATASDPAMAAAEQPSAASALAAADTTGGDYRISARDILEVSVFQVPDLNKTVQVTDDGAVTLPLIGKTKVRGKTTQQAEGLIADRLKKKYMQSPQVSIFVKQYGQRVTISGEVKTPRVMAVDGRMTLTQAIADAGGLSDLAESKRIHIARTVNGRVHDDVYNLDEIQAGHANDPTLHGGDLVVAEQSGARVALKNIKDLLPFAVLASVL